MILCAMGGDHGKTLTIETGVLCNNRCVFCYQKGLRAISRGAEQLLPYEEVCARIRFGVEASFDELSLTGGEPTIRPDFLDIVRYARAQGMRRVAVTTNGARLARPDFFAAAVEAGLTSMGVSVHGPTPEEHDAITGRPGSFAKALRAIWHAVCTQGSSREVQVNTVTVVSRLNKDRILALADVLYAVGVRLMVLQPVIVSKSNFEEASRIRLDLPELVEAVRAVARRGAERGFKVKLFNLPPCLFSDVLGGIEIEHYERATVREHVGTDNLALEEPGCVRLDACAQCAVKSVCPGLHVTLLPQEDLAKYVEERLRAFSARGRKGCFLAGTELLTPESVLRVIRSAKALLSGEVLVTTGGLHSREALEAFVEAGADEVVLVHHQRDTASLDRLLSHAGNDELLLRTAAEVARVAEGKGIRVGVLVNADQAGLKFLNSGVLRMLGKLPVVLRLRIPWREGGPSWQVGMVAAFLAEVARMPIRPAKTVFNVPEPTPFESMVQLPIASLMALGAAHFDTASTVLPNALMDSASSAVNWSCPRLGHGRRDDVAAPPPGCSSVKVLPFTPKMLEASGTRCGPLPGPRGGRSGPCGSSRPSRAHGP